MLSGNAYIEETAEVVMQLLEKGAIQMMDHERREKELQEIFEEIQHSYQILADNTLALQERTLELARTLFESSSQEEPHPTRATLEELAYQSRSQREQFETLLRKSAEAYGKVLEAPSDDHHVVEEAKADLEEASHP